MNSPNQKFRPAQLQEFSAAEIEDYLARVTGPPQSDPAPDRWQSVGAEIGRVEQNPVAIKATPFVWRDPKTFPRRQWVYGHHLIRRFLSTTVAPGAVGKSSLTMVEAVALATGRALLGTHPSGGRHKVWLWNGEDPLEEMERRVAAICLHYGIERAELEGQLFLNSGRDTEIVIATTTRNGTVIARPVIDAMTTTIRENGIDVVYLDPFVACHGASENDNGAINAVAKSIARMADETNTAWDLVHHSRKTGGAEITVEDGRGASALLAAARSGRVLNPMTKEEAERAGVEKPRGFFRVDNGKANLAPPPDKSEWFTLKSVSLDNGGENSFDQPDYVAVVAPWQWPDALEGVTVADLRKVQVIVAAGSWRKDPQATEWVGKAVAQALDLDASDRASKTKISGLLKTWIGTGMLKVIEGRDEKSKPRPMIEVGTWATD